ncbi:MAG: type II toxin-antitoxin system RelE/ParE family toxin [Candidatus Wallbacteria bacterium]|nr:type II toxin-antitoxin system RelE/ParE family toxin [Candidatus Wallbacteria bacterium]
MWKIELSRESLKQLQKTPVQRVRQIIKSLQDSSASDNPYFHKQVKHLTGDLAGLSRLRVGSYRVILRFVKDRQTINVISILPRGNAY